MDDILRQTEIKCKIFSLFLTDAARYMSLDGKTLTELYSSLMRVNCIEHLLHYCTMRMHTHFKSIDESNGNDQGNSNQKQRSQERFS